MSKHQSRIIKSPSNRISIFPGGKILLFFVCSVVLLLAIWIFGEWFNLLLERIHPTVLLSASLLLGASLGVIILHAILSLLIVRGLEEIRINTAWCYRLGFLSSAFLAGVRGIAVAVTSGGFFWICGLLVGVLGAFLGSLWVTGLDSCLWENNSPPANWLQEAVHQRHLERIGEPGTIPIPKRLFDICLALVGLLISSPVWLASACLIWLADPGPILFVKNSVGKGGINFYQLKFRTMVCGAEDVTGPVLASEEDDRVLIVGRFLRKTALDELPQLVNILKGEMSIVGPRPQRTVLVYRYLEKMPEYAERHAVLPGLSGLAQVAGDYYLTPRQKLRFDRLYMQHSNLGFDLKLLLLGFLITFWFRWRKNWNGRLPRQLLRFGSLF
jgi:lipopolysaccharide/colanic/teichoic acid biosynthesis glycosyltransferase